MTLGSIKQFGAKVSRAITAIRAHTVVAVGRKFRFRRNHQERHPVLRSGNVQIRLCTSGK